MPPRDIPNPAASAAHGQRDTRLMAGREVLTRDRLQRRDILTRARGRLHVDLDKIPAGVRYLWVAASVLGQPTPDNVQEALEMGWKPVPPDRHPELVPPSFGDYSRPTDCILKGGQILMERAEEICQEDEESLRQENLRTMREVDTERAASQNRRTPTMPATRSMRSKTVFGREPDVTPADIGGGTFEEE